MFKEEKKKIDVRDGNHQTAKTWASSAALNRERKKKRKWRERRGKI